MAPDALTLENLSLQRPGHVIFSGVSLQVAAGERLALTGINGAGKSSLIRCISGEWAPTSGQIRIQGQPLSGFAPDDRARWMAVLPQASQLNFGFRVEEVVALGRYPHRSGLRRDREIVAAAAETCDIHALLDTPYHQCSGGEQQRVQLARVLAQIWEPVADRPRVLLLDEPVSGLDLSHQHALFDTLERFARSDVCVVFVVHDLNLAGRYASRIAVLSPGGQLITGSPGEILTPEVLRSRFNWPATVIRHPATGDPVVLPSG